MTGYLLRRLSLSLPTLAGIVALTFALLHALPGDPVDARLAAEGSLDLDALASAHLRRQFNLDRPLAAQMLDWLARCIRMDFGASFSDGAPVLQKLGRSLAATVMLNGAAVLVIALVSLSAGILLASHQDSPIDRWGGRGLAVLLALPAAWGALLLQRFFAVDLGWFPLLGSSPAGGASAYWVGWRAEYVFLPLAAASYRGAALYTRLVRASVLSILRSEYVRAARARGVHPVWIHARYTLRNAALPLIGIIPTLAPATVAGSVVVESVFGWPGAGRLMVESILGRDYPVVLALALICALFVHACALGSELLMLASDPRLRSTGDGQASP